MLAGHIKPTLIKIVRGKIKYFRKLPLNVPLVVLGADMKNVLVTNQEILRVFRVSWKDIELVESERIVQTSTFQMMNSSRVVDRRKSKTSIFDK